MYRLLNQPNLLLLLLIPLTVLALWFDVWNAPTPEITLQPGAALVAYLTQHSVPWLDELLGALALLSTAMLVTQLNNSMKVTDARGHVISLVFLALAGSVNLGLSHPAFVATLGLFFVIYNLLNAVGDTQALRAAFNAGFLLGLSALWLHTLLFLLPVLWLSLLIYNQLSFRNLFASWAGVLLPLVYLWVLVLFRDDISLPQYMQQYVAAFWSPVPEQLMSWQQWALLAFVLLLGFWAVVEFFANYYKQIIMRRKSLRVLMAFGIGSFVLVFVLPSASIELFVVAALPAAFLVVRLLHSWSKAWMQSLALWLIVLLVVLVKIDVLGLLNIAF